MASNSPIASIAGLSEVSLSEVTTKIGSGATPRGGSEAYLASRIEYALVRSQNVFDRRFDRRGLAYITSEQAEGLRGVALQRDDVLLNITGDGVTFGRACIVPEDVRPACVNQHVSIIRADPEKADPGYILAFLTHPDVKPYIESFNAGGSRRAITKGHIQSFRLPLPPLDQQRAIARILGALDDKIELNRKMNATLEAMARARFKSWFVDFDPVRAKAERRTPDGMDAATAKLFPSALVESELGPIPKGWLHVSVKDVCAGLFDGPHATPPEAHSGAVFLGIRNFTPTGLELSDARLISEADYPAWTKRVVPRPGDIVFTYEATLGFFALVPPGLRCCLGRRTALVRPRADAHDSHYLFHWFVAEPFQAFLLAHRQPGSTVDRIWLKDFPSYPVLQPPSELMRRFDAAVAPLWARVHTNQAQGSTLAKLRDALLPRLLSGELSVEAAERKVGAVA